MDILTDPVVHPWEKIAKECLPFLADADFEVFLLHSFISHTEASDFLIEYLGGVEPPTWTAAGGMARALLWKGIKDYVERNKDLIVQAYDKFGDAWHMMLDFDFLGLLEPQSAGSNLLNLLHEPNKREAERLRENQTPKGQVFEILDEWLQKLKSLGEIRLHSLEYYAMEFQWKNLVIIPLCRSKLLNDHAWVIPMYRFIADSNQNDELSKLNLTQRQIKHNVLARLGLESWKLALLNDAQLFLQGTASIPLYLRHLIQIGNTLDLDEVGIRIVQSYFDQLNESLTKSLQQVLDSFENLSSLYARSENNQQKEYLHLAYEGLSEIQDNLIPDSLDDNQVHLTIKSMEEWLEKVSSVQGEAFIIYLHWSGYLINMESRGAYDTRPT